MQWRMQQQQQQQQHSFSIVDLRHNRPCEPCEVVTAMSYTKQLLRDAVSAMRLGSVCSLPVYVVVNKTMTSSVTDG